MIRKLLIANRGEIALRIVRTCAEMGVRSVAVYSEADRDSPHVSEADEAYCIGPAPSAESYLAAEKILAAAQSSAADAVHPGYGFLAENAEFAESCQAAGLIFVGPSPRAIRALGDKIGAKRLMREAGVPVLPGYEGEDQSDKTFAREAALIGYPVMVKASAGGGGRGMRMVSEADALKGELAEARREAMAGFGSDRLLLERYIPRSRHVELQIFGDCHGNIIHLFERECSIQRRHQKIIEESPSPILTPVLRERMAEAAVAAGRAASYENAGTVEFIVEESPDGNHQFYFLEVNTRLQVEHPVTEVVTGLDLVRMQLEVAAGGALPITQEEARCSGHAIEVRIYAEDPERGFAPSIGQLVCWLPPGGPGVRLDSGFTQGMNVPVHYDPMLAKMIVRGPDRAAALARLDRALREFSALGVTTIVPYLRAIVLDPEFAAGRYDTKFLEERFANWTPPTEPPEEVLLALAASETILRPTGRGEESAAFSPWQLTGEWRVGR